MKQAALGSVLALGLIFFFSGCSKPRQNYMKSAQKRALKKHSQLLSVKLLVPLNQRCLLRLIPKVAFSPFSLRHRRELGGELQQSTEEKKKEEEED